MKSIFRTSQIGVDLGVWTGLVRLLCQSSLSLLVATVVVSLIEAAVGIGLLYSIKLLIDTLTSSNLSDRQVLPNSIDQIVNDQSLYSIYVLLAATIGVLLLSVLVPSVGQIFRTAQGFKVSQFVDREIHKRAIQLDLEFFESPQYFDSLERARQGGTKRPAQVVEGFMLLLKSLVFLIAILVLLASIHWFVLPVFAAAVIVIFVVSFRYTRILFLWKRDQTQAERHAAYLDWLITSDQHAKELRVGDLGEFLTDSYFNIKSVINRRQLSIEIRRAVAEMFAFSIGIIVFAGATVFVVFEVINGHQTIGQLVLFVLLFRRAEMNGRELVLHASKLYDHKMYLQQLFGFLGREPKVLISATPRAIPPVLESGIEFKNVSFKYPGVDEFALKCVNIKIELGKVVALVGDNGSGKTTLIKLLTRLYDPSSGKVLLNGNDVRNYEPAEYRREFSVIFQDYARYAATVRDNIRYGDVKKIADTSSIEIAARRAEAVDLVHSLHSGYDTPLSRLFDGGQEISLGQWQRIALARAFFPDSSFVVLDEPSSALDPQAEFEIFENFRESIGNRSALIISHRLSTIRLADYIYVLDQGQILEEGSHRDLVALNGRYAKLFEQQGRGYRGSG